MSDDSERYFPENLCIENYCAQCGSFKDEAPHKRQGTTYQIKDGDNLVTVTEERAFELLDVSGYDADGHLPNQRSENPGMQRFYEAREMYLKFLIDEYRRGRE